MSTSGNLNVRLDHERVIHLGKNRANGDREQQQLKLCKTLTSELATSSEFPIDFLLEQQQDVQRLVSSRWNSENVVTKRTERAHNCGVFIRGQHMPGGRRQAAPKHQNCHSLPARQQYTTGYVFLLYGAAATWAARKQQSISTSTTEPRYVGLCNAAKEAVWLCNLFRDLGRAGGDYAIRICRDNQGALRLTGNLEFHVRLKHIDIQGYIGCLSFPYSHLTALVIPGSNRLPGYSIVPETSTNPSIGEMHVYKVHTREMHASEVHAHEIKVPILYSGLIHGI